MKNIQKVLAVGVWVAMGQAAVWAGAGSLRSDNRNNPNPVEVTLKNGSTTLLVASAKGGTVISQDVLLPNTAFTASVYLRNLNGGLVKSGAPACSATITPPFNSNAIVGMNLIIAPSMQFGLNCSLTQMPGQN